MIRQLFMMGALALTLAAGPGGTQPVPDGPVPTSQTADLVAQLWEGLALEPLMPVLRDEALVAGDEMAAMLFEGPPSPRWSATIRRMHRPERLAGLMHAALAEAMTGADPIALSEALAFYRTDPGQRLLRLELSARAALVDPDADQAARDAFAVAEKRGDPRADLIRDLMEAADLVEPNVAGGMNAMLSFSQGFAAGGGYAQDVSEAQMLADAWAEADALRAETIEWNGAYLMLAYSPLPDAALHEYAGFAASPAGQALNDVLFAAFDAMFRRLSYEVGLAAAAELRGRKL